MATIAVIGAGLGGLAAAVRLAAAGQTVHVLEAADAPGGKAGVALLDGVEVDTGPSVLTMPDVLAELLALADMRLGEHLVLREPIPAFRYRYPDGCVLDVHCQVDQTLDSVATTLGARARDELAAFLVYAGRIWAAAEPAFVRGPAPGLGTLLARPFKELLGLFAIDPLGTMNGAIRARVREPHLVTLLQRYATYNGSDLRRAPAALNCIAHLELALGGYGVEGGIAEIARTLERAATQLGARVRYDARVERLLLRDGRVSGLVLQGGEELSFDAVVSNAEARHTLGTLLPEPRPALGPLEPDSTSGWTGILRARRRTGAEARVSHTVLFPEDYNQEFVDLFDHDRPPEQPTVYLCAQEPCHGRAGWAEHEPVFVMVNAPPEPRDGPRPPEVWSRLEARVLARLREAGLSDPDDGLVWTRTPAELARRFPGSRGALYGRASNGPWAAFQRPANRGAVPGLYLASGTVHPGGGMPLAMLSGQQAAMSLLADLALPRR